MPWELFAIIEALQLGLFAFVVWLLEGGRNRLLRAIISRSAAEYAALKEYEEKSPERREYPVVDDEFEAALAEHRKRTGQAYIEEMVEG